MALEVACQSTVPADPGQGAFDDPSSRQDLEADLFSDFLDDLDGDRGGVLDAPGAVGAVGEGRAR